MGWASNLTSRKRNEVGSKKSHESWEDLLQEDHMLGSKAPLDLPRDLTFIDIETSLPKLSVLAAGGSS
jgi:anaphase-promoting complex subunit 4